MAIKENCSDFNIINEKWNDFSQNGIKWNNKRQMVIRVEEILGIAYISKNDVNSSIYLLQWILLFINIAKNHSLSNSIYFYSYKYFKSHKL